MKKNILLSVVLCCFILAAQAAGASEDNDEQKFSIKKAGIPNINMTPTLNSVMSSLRKDDAEKKIETNGDILGDGNVIVDDIVDPKCVFYGNYNNGSGDAEQYFDIETIIFECD
jgi:hypothetical protein